MLKYIFIFLFVVQFNNCSSRGKVVQTNQIFRAVSRDTLITCDIEGISSESVQCKANYVNGRVIKIITDIYSGAWRASIIYEFKRNKIKISETKYSYHVEIENVLSENHMSLDRKITYAIDFNGNIIGDPIRDRIDIFQEIKKIVPFELK